MSELPPVNPYEDAGYWHQVKREQEDDAACPECDGLPPHVSGVATHRAQCWCHDPRPRATCYWIGPTGNPGQEQTFGTPEQLRAGWDRRRGELVEVREGWHDETE